MIFEDSPTNPRLGPSEHNPPMPIDIFGNPKPETELPPMPKDMYLPNFGREKSAKIETLNSEPSEEMKAIDQINKYWEAAFDQLMGLPGESFDKKLANIGENTDNQALSANTPINKKSIFCNLFKINTYKCIWKQIKYSN